MTDRSMGAAPSTRGGEPLTPGIKALGIGSVAAFGLAFLAGFGLGLAPRRALGVAAALLLLIPLLGAAAAWLRRAKYHPRAFWMRMSAVSFSVLVLNLIGRSIVVRADVRAPGASLLVDIADRSTSLIASMLLFVLVVMFSALAARAPHENDVTLGAGLTGARRWQLAVGLLVVAGSMLAIPAIVYAL